MQQFYLALDLKNNEESIASYEKFHKEVWPEVLDSIADAGIYKMEIFRVSNRLFMIIEATDDFSFEKKSTLDRDKTTVQKWEALMWQFQQAIPGAASEEKWLLMKKIFEFNK
ncbi:MAG: L-rhamnose mutarotase [Ferruginibacter sp.]